VQTPSSIFWPSSIKLDEYPERTSNNQMYTYLQDRRKISTFKHFEGNTILSAVITSVVQVAKLAISLHWLSGKFLISEPLFEKTQRISSHI
jgi:hypothetical protein